MHGLPAFSSLTQRLSDGVRLVVLGCEPVHFRVRYLLNALDQVSDTVPIHRIAKLGFSIDLVAIGDGDIPHVVAKARDL